MERVCCQLSVTATGKRENDPKAKIRGQSLEREVFATQVGSQRWQRAGVTEAERARDHVEESQQLQIEDETPQDDWRWPADQAYQPEPNVSQQVGTGEVITCNRWKKRDNQRSWQTTRHGPIHWFEEHTSASTKTECTRPKHDVPKSSTTVTPIALNPARHGLSFQ